jgi:hypothetical protein
MAGEREIEIKYSLYELSDVHKVPETVGIYAWFLVPLLNGDRVRREPDKLIERIRHLRDCLFFESNHKILLSQENKRFSSEWTASVGLGPPELNFGSVEAMAASERHAFLDHFRHVFTMISPVVYVGKADNLRRRISDHKRALLDALTPNPWAVTADSPEKQMADRAVRAGIEAADLRFTFFEFPSSEDLKTPATTNALVEEFVNRLVQPRLGRE